MYTQASVGSPNVLVTSQSNYQTFSKQTDNPRDLTIAQSSELLHQSYIALCQQRGMEIDKILLYQNMKIREKNWVELDLEREIGAEMFKIVCEVMKINKFYLSFKAKNYEMNSTHFQIIDALIKERLIEFSMNNCSLTTNALQSFGQLIKNKQCKIQKLKLINNQIGYDGACILQEAISYHKYLKYIYIEYCGIDNETISQIMNAADTIQNLQFISLEGNKIESDQKKPKNKTTVSQKQSNQ